MFVAAVQTTGSRTKLCVCVCVVPGHCVQITRLWTFNCVCITRASEMLPVKFFGKQMHSSVHFLCVTKSLFIDLLYYVCKFTCLTYAML